MSVFGLFLRFLLKNGAFSGDVSDYFGRSCTIGWVNFPDLGNIIGASSNWALLYLRRTFL